MHLFYEFMFGLSILFMVFFRGSLLAARGAGREGEQRMLRWAVIGLNLTAASYLFRILGPAHSGHSLLLGFLCGAGGALALGRAWAERGRLRLEAPRDRLQAPDAARQAAPSSSLDVHHVLMNAELEAWRRGASLADTEHLLLAVLRERHSGAMRVLAHLGVPPAQLRDVLQGRAGRVVREAPRPCPGTGEALTDRAREVMALAAQEAHRFDSACVGTEHLLLGLALAGRGAAAHVLAQEGVTVDQIRQCLLADRVPKAAPGREGTLGR